MTLGVELIGLNVHWFHEKCFQKHHQSDAFGIAFLRYGVRVYECVRVFAALRDIREFGSPLGIKCSQIKGSNTYSCKPKQSK